MPLLDIEQFDEAPQVGDTVTITGKIQEIKKGKVEMSHDSVVLLPGSSEGNAQVSVDESFEKFRKTQNKQEDNIATQ